MAKPNPNPNPVVKYTQIFINNQWINAESGKKFATVNPANEKVIAQVAEGDKADVDKAVAAARAAFARGSVWRNLDASARGRLIFKLADLMERDVNELASLESLDQGKPFSNSYAEVLDSVKTMRYFAGCADKVHGLTLPVDGNCLALTKKEPIGVVGAIVPWNYPIILTTMKLAPALAAGTTIVLKPAEQTPLTALALAALIKEAEFPPGVVNIVPGYGPTAGAAISEHHDINKIAFTGSGEIGFKIVAASGNSNLKRVNLELGGKSPLVIFDDADVEQALMYAYHGVFRNTGQTCLAPTRLFVQSGIYDKVVQKAVKLASETKVGDAFDPNSFYGPQIDERILNRVLDLIESGKREGAKLETGGGRHGKVGYFVQPTVFSNVTDNMRIAKEEIFGPVQSIFKFDTLEEVIRRSNDTNYGLVAGVFTKNIDVALEFANAVEAGTVWVNEYLTAKAQMPFGGYKQSGIGRELGLDSLNDYLEVKSICIKTRTKN